MLRPYIEEDFNELIQHFLTHNSTQYIDFCTEWKRMCFGWLYTPLECNSDVAELTDELLYVAKCIFVSKRPWRERLCALYIMYTVYYKQPNDGLCHINITSNEWDSVLEFDDWLEEQTDTIQVKYVLCKLFLEGAFLFTYSESEYRLEKNDNENQEGAMGNFSAEETLKPHLKEFQDESEGFLPALEVLEDGYNEMKEMLSKDKPNEHQTLKTTSFFDVYREGFNKINEILQSKESDDNRDQPSTSGYKKSLKQKAFTTPVQNRFSEYKDQEAKENKIKKECDVTDNDNDENHNDTELDSATELFLQSTLRDLGDLSESD